MATTMVKDTTNAKWVLTESGHSGQTYTKTIKCGGTYMEYDVDLVVTVAAGSATTPTTSITANPTISVAANGKITATVSKTQSVTPTVVAGYVSGGTAGDVTVSGSTEQSLPVKATATYTPGTTDQTIAVSGNTSGFYVTGVQKILGDANLIASNIKSGVSIFGVLGTLTSIATDDPNVDNAAAPQILEGYEAFDKNGGTLTGSMTNYSGVDLTSSVTSGKTTTLTYSSQSGLYTIKMYAGSTGYVQQNSTFITDTVAASTMNNSHTDNIDVTPSLAEQVVSISAGYYDTGRTVTIAAMTQGAVTTPATTIEVAPVLSTTYTTNKGYKISVSGSQNVKPSVTTAGYITSSEATNGTITVTDDGLTYVAQSTISNANVSPSTSGSQTITVTAGYYPTDRTITVAAITTGSITLGASVSSSIVPTDYQGNAFTIGSTTLPSGNNYVKLTPKANATASAATFNPGYIASAPSDATLSNQAGTALYVNVYDGTVE